MSLGVHEWAHAYAAWRLGDDTAKMLGRLTLNPIVHIDPVGTFLLPLLGVPFGWAKPVPFNPLRFRAKVSMTTGSLITAAAGPFSNLIFGVICLLLYYWSHLAALPATITMLFGHLVLLNVMLALFNLLPIAPLDGSYIVDALIPYRFRSAWSKVRAAGPALLLTIVLLTYSLNIHLFEGPITMVQKVLTKVAYQENNEDR